MSVAVTPLSDGMTGILTDGSAGWVIPRPASSLIPAGVRRVVFTAHGFVPTHLIGQPSGSLGSTSTPRTVTGWRAQRLTSFINALPLAAPGTISSCPISLPESSELTFYGSSSPALARATEYPTGCSSVSVNPCGPLTIESLQAF